MKQKVTENINALRSLLRKPPSVEGIDPSLQIQSRREAIRLKAKQILGKQLNFSEYKKLLLSNKMTLSRSADPKDETYKIDEDVQSLVNAINQKPYAVTIGACSGHMRMVNGQPDLDDNGFIGFELDSVDQQSEVFLRKINAVCDEFNSRSNGCNFTLAKTKQGSYVLFWHWSNSAYQKERVLIDQHIASSEKDHQGFSEEMARLTPVKRIVSHIAAKKGVINEYKAFIDAVAKALGEK